jgi:two-component system chemotaxis response regulator CheB
VQHRSPVGPSLLPRILARRTPLAVKLASEGEELRPGTVYLAPADQHLVIEARRRLAFTDGRRIRFVRSSANPLLESAAEVLGGRVIAVVLTGGGADATDGVQAVKAAGGVVIAQDRATSQVFGMPRSAIETGAVDYVLPLDEIAPTLRRLVGAGQHTPPDSAAGAPHDGRGRQRP